jgi:NADH dehydrogenase (ubiquinone) Fe-S protein 8
LLKLDPRQRRYDGSSDELEDYDEVDESTLDLQLGYERAGGGKRGNRAKLGKLIVHDEGLKMLDLVVAANVGMLWASWEKIS